MAKIPKPGASGGAAKTKLIIQLSASNGTSLAGQPVTVTELNSGLEIASFNYSGQPETLKLPAGITFKVSTVDRMAFVTPEPVTGVLVDDTTVVLSFLACTRYGYRREKANSNPDTRITYLFDAVGKTPMSVNLSTHAPVWGDWKDFVYEVAAPVMLNTDGTEAYELNRENQTLKATGESSDVANSTFDGNAMVRFSGKWKWVKRYEDASYQYVIFADGQADETYKAHAHTNINGNIMDRFYWGMYKGGNVGNKLRSIAGLSVMVNQTRNTEVAYAQAIGAGYDTIYNSGWQYIADLLTLVSKNDNGQAVFGSGRSKSSNSAAIATGSTKSYGPFWGSSDETSDVKVFWIEGASSLNLDGSGFSSGNMKVSVAKPSDGKVKFTVSPKGEIPPRVFFRVKLKWSAEKDSNTKRCAEEDISSRAFCSFLRMVCGVRCARIGQGFDTTKADDDCSFALARTAQKRGCVFGREMR